MSKGNETLVGNRFRDVSAGAVTMLLMAGVIILFFNRLAGGDLILARGDVYLYFYPYWQAASEALIDGRIPLWNPYLFMGAPFLANSQVGFFYPLNWPLWMLLDTPYAVSASILAHLIIASGGVYLVGRKCLSFSRPAALLAAVLYALGGYVTSQVEHVNQIQGIAWLPWYFVVLCTWLGGERTWKDNARLVAGFSAILSLQLLSGHTQTVFISMMAVMVWLLVTVIGQLSADGSASKAERVTMGVRRAWSLLWPILASVLLAVGIVAIQIIPTLELSGYSLRRGGLPLNEVLSFSLQPVVLAQAMLPSYDHLIFSEYVAFVPVVALMLTVFGLRQSWNMREARPFVILLFVGLLLALGRFNPLYHLLASLPGFNLFRAPARWSILYALGVALVAAAGWQRVLRTGQNSSVQAIRRKDARDLTAGVMFVVFLVAWAIASSALARLFPVAPETNIEMPSGITLVAWLVELGVSAVLVLTVMRGRATEVVPWIMLAGAISVLFISTRILPYNHPTTPKAFSEQRAPISRMLANKECPAQESSCWSASGRILGLSDIFFDLGDQVEMDGTIGHNLGELERFDYIVASKQKEVLGPNLPLIYELFSVDGFDGGILPLEKYAVLMGLILPSGEQTLDGRLREQVESIPDEKWLDLFATKYVITDKVGDQWLGEIFFDMKHPAWVTGSAGPVQVGFLPRYEATDLYLIGEGKPGNITIVTASGEKWSLEPESPESDLWRVRFPQPAFLDQIVLNPCPVSDGQDSCDGWQVKSLALVDNRDSTFKQIVAGNYRLLYSGDVKIYENLDTPSLATLLFDWQFVNDHRESISAMHADGFDPDTSGIVIGTGQNPPGSGEGQATIVSYKPEHVILNTESDQRALLLLREANYPGWQATIDGMPTEIVETDILFRGVFVPPGAHIIELAYRPASFQIGWVISLLSLIVWFALVVFAFVIPVPGNLHQSLSGACQ